MKILIVTTEPNWNSWEAKKAACRGGIGLVENIGDVILTVERFREKLVPTIDGRVDTAWFNKMTLDARARGYQAVVLHMSETKAHKWGIKSSLRGSCLNDEAIGEIYIISDEDTTVNYDSGKKVNRFVKVFLHEVSHWMARTLRQEDKTHHYDYFMESVWMCMKDYVYPMGLIDIINTSFRRERVTMPFDMSNITQPFGAVNTAYISGIHAGVDIGCKVGTPILAPTDGKIALVWKNHKDLGNACTFEWHYNGKMYTMRLAHLKSAPIADGYTRGSVIAYSGNTGKSSGPHIHCEVWKTGYDVNVLYNEKLIRTCLVNPVVLFKGITV